MRDWNQDYRFLVRFLIILVILLDGAKESMFIRWFVLFCALLVIGPLQAAEQNNAPDANGTLATMPSGVTVTLSQVDAPAGTNWSAGGTTFTANGAAFAGNPAANYAPAINLSATTFNLFTSANGLPSTTGQQTPRGTLTITFSQPVTNPVLHFARLGGANGVVSNATAFTLRNGVSGTTGDMTVLASAQSLRVVAGTGGARIETISDAPSTGCTVPASTSGCGSVRVNGTYQVLTFDVTLQLRTNGTGGPVNQGADAYGLAISLDEDFADEPASYDNGSAAAVHQRSDLALGTGGIAANRTSPYTGVAANSGVTADLSGTVYATFPATSPIPGNAAASSDTDNAFSAALANVQGGSPSYSLTVPVSGVSAAARLCGWIDFNRNGAYGTGNETVCTNVASGAASAVLTWTLPTGAAYVAGNSYLRLRLGYTAAEVQSPTGVASSGEVENYPIVLLAEPILRLSKALPLGRFVATDQFTMSISGAVGTASVTTTGSGITATGTATLNPASNSAYTFSETGASGANLANYVTTYSCTNARVGGQTPSGNGTTFSITPVSGDDLTCTVTNRRNPLANLAITKTNTPGLNGEVDQAADTVTSGAPTTYTIVVSNTGPDAADGARVTDPALANLTCTTASCVATGSGTCPAQTGAALVAVLQGAGAIIPTLPVGGTVTFSLTCTVQ